MIIHPGFPGIIPIYTYCSDTNINTHAFKSVPVWAIYYTVTRSSLMKRLFLSNKFGKWITLHPPFRNLQHIPTFDKPYNKETCLISSNSLFPKFTWLWNSFFPGIHINIPNIHACSVVPILCKNPVDYSPPVSSVHVFSRQKYQSGLPFLPAGNLPDSGIKPTSPESPILIDGLFTTEPPGKH